MIVINEMTICILLLTIPTLMFILEAFLEVVVIALKADADKLPNWNRLNQKEHIRSGMLATMMISPYIGVAIYNGLWWMLIPIIINRRLVFDPCLKIMRKRKLSLYEGRGPVDQFCARIFGINGAKYEIAAELIISLTFFFIQI